jgi:hypothetical protein
MRSTFTAVLLTTALAGCGDDKTPDNNPTPDAPVTPDSPAATCEVTPGAWAAPNFATNAAETLALRAQIDLLTGNPTMRGAETGTVVVDIDDLNAVYDAGTPVLSSKVHTAFNTVVDDSFAEFVPAVAAGVQDLVVEPQGWTPGANGALFAATRKAAFNVGGIEVRQIVDKGLFAGGALYPHALSLTEGTITGATIDSLAAAWGSSETLETTVVTDSANYTFQMGFHGQVAAALTDAKAYAASADCTAERDEAIVRFFRTWEKAMFARAVFYANKGDDGLAAAAAGNAGDDARATALHEFAEGMGLAAGFRGMPDPATGPLAGAGRVTTDADIDAMLGAVGVNLTDLAASTVGDFVADGTGAFRTGVTTLETRVKTVFALTDADITAFRAPTPN